MIGLPAYWDMLKSHDWSYQYSDAHGVYLRGSESAGRLRVYAAQSPEHQALHDAFTASYADRTPWPERPAEEEIAA